MDLKTTKSSTVGRTTTPRTTTEVYTPRISDTCIRLPEYGVPVGTNMFEVETNVSVL